jgi:hypothetical protein
MSKKRRPRAPEAAGGRRLDGGSDRAMGGCAAGSGALLMTTSGAFIVATPSAETGREGARSGVPSTGAGGLSSSTGSLRGAMSGTDASGGGSLSPGPGPRLGLWGSNTPLVVLGAPVGFFESVMASARLLPIPGEGAAII